MWIKMFTLEISENARPKHRLEVKERGRFENIREGPYIVHNVLVNHVEFLKFVNQENEPRVFRIFPFGGSHRAAGDVIALLTWYFMVVYPCVAIPTTAERYIGLENYFTDITMENKEDLHIVNTHQRQTILKKLNFISDRRVVIMLCTSSYWRSRVIDPVLCLSFLTALCIAGIIVQLETMDYSHGN
ncbi:hypothetical protein KUTeg_016542 [Tegillarca granosa]|uniref:Uncharacterized protein n=1 Tax=Tegillarca granosa TaxID=220873 RepID=A0ABQ9EQX5_TEGGR|nr:hypothetical protein KUTeg_016542 [Tegillarca granosa]